jgi:DNA polymerase I-like protein with 3'-5' exonuclease and polymerase domains
MLYGAGAEKYIEMVEEQSLKNPHLAIKIPTIDEARGVLKEHEKAYPEWPVFKRYAIGLARQNGYAMDAYGRRWVLPDINSTDGKRRSAAEREVMSMAVQGTASTLVKMAMLKTDGLDTTGLLMLMQVHDELVWQWRGKEGDREEVRLAVQERMELGQPFVRGEWSDVRLKVEPKWVTNWKEAK